MSAAALDRACLAIRRGRTVVCRNEDDVRLVQNTMRWKHAWNVRLEALGNDEWRVHP